MSKASSGYQQALSSWRSLIGISRKSRLSKQNWKGINRWAVWLLCIAAMWWWHWKLLLATVVGIGLMSLTYLFQGRGWQKYCVKWQHFLTGFNRRLTIAVASGGMGGFSIYLATSIWESAENRWLASGLILQGFASVITLGLLIGYLWQGKQQSQESQVNKLLGNLTHRDPLKRLIAIRQLTRLLKNNNLSEEYYWQVIECYQLMLSNSQVPTIKRALLDSLDELGIKQNHPSTPKPVKIPIKLSTNSMSIVDYS